MTLENALSSDALSFGRLNVLAMIRHLIEIGAPILTFDGVPPSGGSGVGFGADNNQVSTGAICIDTANGDVYVNQGVTGTPLWQLIGLGGGALGQTNSPMIHARFNEDDDEDSVGTHNFRVGDSDIIIPEGAIIILGILDVQDALTSGGAATVSLGVDGSPANIQSAAAISGLPWDGSGPQAIVDGPDNMVTPANYVKTTSESPLTYTIGVDSITSGRFDLFLYWLGSTT